MEGRRTIMKPNEKSMHGANTMNDMSILWKEKEASSSAYLLNREHHSDISNCWFFIS
jgi:hypothetical protein